MCQMFDRLDHGLLARDFGLVSIDYASVRREGERACKCDQSGIAPIESTVSSQNCTFHTYTWREYRPHIEYR